MKFELSNDLISNRNMYTKVETSGFGHSFLTFIHLALVIADIAYPLWFSGGDISYIQMVILYHSPFLVPTLLYFLVPALGRTAFFRGIVSTILGLTVIVGGAAVLFFAANNVMEFVLFISLGFIVPGALLLGSLLMLLSAGHEREAPRFVMVPQEYLQRMPVQCPNQAMV